MDQLALVLRLAGPLQSWGSSSQNNRRETDLQPTKAGVVGLLAAASGLRRTDPIEDLVSLELGVRIDQPGSLLRDYHTVSDFRGRPLLSANLTSRGAQKPTSPKKHTHVTQRFYLQDACFVAAVRGEATLIQALVEALRRPAFPLALGRRSCPPTQPLLLHDGASPYWSGTILEVLARVPWQASVRERKRHVGGGALPVTYDDPSGVDIATDVPVSFAPKERGMAARRVSTGWVRPMPSDDPDAMPRDAHDPFSLLGDV